MLYDDIKQTIEYLHLLILTSHEDSKEGVKMLNALFKLAHQVSQLNRKDRDKLIKAEDEDGRTD